MPSYKVAKADAGQRADLLVARKLPKYSRSALQGLFDKGLATVSGRPAKASQKLATGQTINIDTTLLTTPPAKIDIPVIYEDDEVIVMNKPAGVLTHSKGALNLEATVASFIKPKLKDKNMKGNRAGVVHRLDRGTSGVIIAAKTEDALKFLQKQFSNRQTDKYYLAVVEGQPEPAKATIDAPIGRNPRRPQTFKVMASGKPAQTEYQALKAGKSSLVELRPRTGRTHQLRVHLAYIGHPIVGDYIYGHDGGPIKLHAWKLKLRLPSGQTKQFVVEPPVDFWGNS